MTTILLHHKASLDGSVSFTITQQSPGIVRVCRMTDGEESLGFYTDEGVALREQRTWFTDLCILRDRNPPAVTAPVAPAPRPMAILPSAPYVYVREEAYVPPFPAPRFTPVARLWVMDADGSVTQHPAECDCVDCLHMADA